MSLFLYCHQFIQHCYIPDYLSCIHYVLLRVLDSPGLFSSLCGSKISTIRCKYWMIANELGSYFLDKILVYHKLNSWNNFPDSFLWCHSLKYNWVNKCYQLIYSLTYFNSSRQLLSYINRLPYTTEFFYHIDFLFHYIFLSKLKWTFFMVITGNYGSYIV